MSYGQRKNSFVGILLTVELTPQSHSAQEHGEADDDETALVADLQRAGDVGDLRGSKRCTIPVEQADGGVGGAGRGHTDGERHLCLAVGRHLHGVESGRDDLHGIGQRRDLHLYRVRVAVADGHRHFRGFADHVHAFRRRDRHTVDQQGRELVRAFRHRASGRAFAAQRVQGHDGVGVRQLPAPGVDVGFVFSVRLDEDRRIETFDVAR